MIWSVIDWTIFNKKSHFKLSEERWLETEEGQMCVPPPSIFIGHA